MGYETAQAWYSFLFNSDLQSMPYVRWIGLVSPEVMVQNQNDCNRCSKRGDCKLATIHVKNTTRIWKFKLTWTSCKFTFTSTSSLRIVPAAERCVLVALSWSFDKERALKFGLTFCFTGFTEDLKAVGVSFAFTGDTPSSSWKERIAAFLHNAGSHCELLLRTNMPFWKWQ